MVKTNLVFPNSKEERKNNGLSKEKKEGVVRLCCCCCLFVVVVVCCCCSLEHQSATESIEILIIKRARERERSNQKFGIPPRSKMIP